MGWTGPGGYDPMMHSMQNGMANGAWGAFPNMMGKVQGLLNIYRHER